MMFPNLNAEQARKAMSNVQVAQLIGISRASYSSKKRSGKFTVPQINTLLALFGCTFDYLFETENGGGAWKGGDFVCGRR